MREKALERIRTIVNDNFLADYIHQTEIHLYVNPIAWNIIGDEGGEKIIKTGNMRVKLSPNSSVSFKDFARPSVTLYRDAMFDFLKREYQYVPIPPDLHVHTTERWYGLEKEESIMQLLDNSIYEFTDIHRREPKEIFVGYKFLIDLKKEFLQELTFDIKAGDENLMYRGIKISNPPFMVYNENAIVASTMTLQECKEWAVSKRIIADDLNSRIHYNPGKGVFHGGLPGGLSYWRGADPAKEGDDSTVIRDKDGYVFEVKKEDFDIVKKKLSEAFGSKLESEDKMKVDWTKLKDKEDDESI